MKDPPAPCSTILVNHGLLHYFCKNNYLHNKKEIQENHPFKDGFSESLIVLLLRLQVMLLLLSNAQTTSFSDSKGVRQSMLKRSVEPLCSRAEEAGDNSPNAPSAIRLPLNPITKR